MGEPVTEPEVRGWFELAGLYVFLEYDEATRAADYASYLSTATHEMDHFALMTGTTFGLFTYVVHVLTTYLVMVCTQRLVNLGFGTEQSPIRVPLRRWRTLSKGRVRAVLDESLLEFAIADIMCQRLSLGRGMQSSPKLAEEYGFIKGLISEWLAHMYPPDAVLGSPDPLANLVCTPPRGASLGALDLLESHARLAQTINTFGFEQELLKHENAQTLRDLAARSRTSFFDEGCNLLGQFVGHYGRAFEVAGSYLKLQTSDDLAIFAMLCDLALMSPLGFSLDESQDGHRYAWNDIHPGWRFVRSLQFLKESAIHRRIGANYVDLTDAICDHFDWSTPWDLAKTALEGRIIEPWKPLPALFERAFKLRLELPDIYACSWRCKADPSVWRDTLLPPIIQLRDSLKTRGTQEDIAKLSLALCQENLAKQLVAKERLQDPLLRASSDLGVVALNVLDTAFGITPEMLMPIA